MTKLKETLFLSRLNQKAKPATREKATALPVGHVYCGETDRRPSVDILEVWYVQVSKNMALTSQREASSGACLIPDGLIMCAVFVLIVGWRCGFSCHISISGVQLKKITFWWFWWIVSKYFSDISKNYCLDDGQTNWRNDRHFWTTVCLSLQSVRTMVLMMMSDDEDVDDVGDEWMLMLMLMKKSNLKAGCCNHIWTACYNHGTSTTLM